MNKIAVLIGVTVLAGKAFAQDADVTIFVGGALLDLGGVVDVRVAAAAGATVVPQTITLTDRFARITFQYPPEGSYNFRFRPAPDAAAREGMDRFTTMALSVGTLYLDGPEGEQEFDTQTIRVLPFAEYGAADPAERTAAAWGQTQEYADVPPANEWGARALEVLFETDPEDGGIGLICDSGQAVTVCTPDVQDALLMEARWWRSVAEGRLERLRHDALTACYDGGGLFGRPERCDEDAGDGWPTYVPAD